MAMSGLNFEVGGCKQSETTAMSGNRRTPVRGQPALSCTRDIFRIFAGQNSNGVNRLFDLPEGSIYSGILT